MKRLLAIWAMQCLCNARHLHSIISEIVWLGGYLMDNFGWNNGKGMR